MNKMWSLFCFVTILLINIVHCQAKLNVGVYYESLCPDSIRFIQSQLATEYPNFADFIDLDLIPFGKSTSGDGTTFECQHGPLECEGNRIQSCVLSAASDTLSQVNFVACQMSYTADPSGQSCAEQAGISFESVTDCHVGHEGLQLQLLAEKKTQSIAHPRSMLAFVPTIVYNHVFDQDKQNRSLRNFRGVLCEEIAKISNLLPSVCGGH